MKQNKRILTHLIFGLILFFMSSCNNTTCQHTYESWKATLPATCTTDGQKERVCSKCGNKEIEKIPATGHNFVNGICTDCGENQ